MISNLGVCFALRCFQRLSDPDIATQRCSWRSSWYTSGLFLSVLSSIKSQSCDLSHISMGSDYIFIPAFFQKSGEPTSYGSFSIFLYTSPAIRPAAAGTSRYGVKSKIFISSLLVFFFLVI